MSKKEYTAPQVAEIRIGVRVLQVASPPVVVDPSQEGSQVDAEAPWFDDVWW